MTCNCRPTCSLLKSILLHSGNVYLAKFTPNASGAEQRIEILFYSFITHIAEQPEITGKAIMSAEPRIEIYMCVFYS